MAIPFLDPCHPRKPWLAELFVASTHSTTLEALDAEATGARVVFEWREDRFCHAIYGVCLGEAFLLAESVEGDAVNTWPPSPPLQQLHKQRGEAGNEIVFATGMAGKNYWSGSITTSVDRRWTEVTFEFACRHRVPPDWLGATYRIAGGIRAEPKNENEVLLTIRDSLKYTIFGAAIPTNLATEMVPTASVSLAGRTISIAAKQTTHTTTATTNRWAYSVQLTRPDGVEGPTNA